MNRKLTIQQTTSNIGRTILHRIAAISMAAFILLLCPGCTINWEKAGAGAPAVTVAPADDAADAPQVHTSTLAVADIPKYSGDPYVVINDNIPDFEQEDMTERSFETYSDLDSLGRCGEAYACIGKDLMPTEERGAIGNIKPSGWRFAKYDFIDGKYLFNRCHLIGFQLTAENDNEKNLITGTRYMNTEGMLPFENEVARYIRYTNNHVLFRVTPVYKGKDLVARGVEMEALSVEDEGEGVRYHIFAYNCQPGVTINYATGKSWLSESDDEEVPSVRTVPGNISYILNTNSGKFHRPDCDGAEKISPHNRQEYSGTREELIQKGFQPCGMCNP